MRARLDGAQDAAGPGARAPSDAGGRIVSPVRGWRRPLLLAASSAPGIQMQIFVFVLAVRAKFAHGAARPGRQALGATRPLDRRRQSTLSINSPLARIIIGAGQRLVSIWAGGPAPGTRGRGLQVSWARRQDARPDQLVHQRSLPGRNKGARSDGAPRAAPPRCS